MIMRMIVAIALGIAKSLRLLKNLHRRLEFIQRGWGEERRRRELITVFKYSKSRYGKKYQIPYI